MFHLHNFLDAFSVVMYESPHKAFGMPSFMLFDLGCDKSIINLQLFGWCRFGITPNLLIWMVGSSDF